MNIQYCNAIAFGFTEDLCYFSMETRHPELDGRPSEVVRIADIAISRRYILTVARQILDKDKEIKEKDLTTKVSPPPPAVRRIKRGT